MTYLALLMASICATAGVYGITRHDYAGIPFLLIGVVILVVVLARRHTPTIGE